MATTPAELRRLIESAWQDHADSIRVLQLTLAKLEAAARVPRAEVEESVRTAVGAGRVLRRRLVEAQELLAGGAVSDSSDVSSIAPDAQGLRDVIQRALEGLDELARSVPRRRLECLLAELRDGRCVVEPAFKRQQRETARRAAVGELQTALGAESVDLENFPGPPRPGDAWLSWFWALECTDQDRAVEALGGAWPKLVGLLGLVSPEEWLASDAASAPAFVAGAESVAPTNSGVEQRAVAPVDGAPRSQVDDVPPALVDVVAPPPVVAVAPKSLDEPARALQEDQPRPEATIATGVEVEPRIDPDRESAALTAAKPPMESDTNDVVPGLVPSLDASDSPATTRDVREGADSQTGETRDDLLARPLASGDASPVGLDAAGAGKLCPQAERDATAAPLEEGASSSESPPASESPVVSASGSPADAGAELAVAQAALKDCPPIQTLEAFQQGIWLAIDGKRVPAPWQREEFVGELAKLQTESLFAGRWAVATLVSAAAEKVEGGERCAPAALVQWCSDFCRGLSSHGSPLDTSALTRRLRAALKEATPLAESPADWLALLMLILDHDACPLTSLEADNLMELAEISEPGKRLLAEWQPLQRSRRAAFVMRERVTSSQTPVVDLKRSVQDKRSELKADLSTMYKAAGGRIETTHCRDAWDTFMQEVHPALERIAQGRADDTDKGVASKLGKRATRVFDRGGVRYGDRSRMDRAVRQLAASARAALQAEDMLAETRTKARQASKNSDFSPNVIAAVKSARAPVSCLSDWVLRLVRGHLEAHPIADEDDAISVRELLSRPLLVEGWGGLSPDVSELGVDQVRDPVRAAARLLEPPLAEPVEDALGWLLQNRPDLVDVDAPLPPEAIRALERRRERIEQQTEELDSRLRAVEVRLAELADDHVITAREALGRVEAAAHATLEPLVWLWLQETTSALERRATARWRALVSQAVVEHDDPAEVRRMEQAGQSARLLRLLSQDKDGTEREVARASMFRDQAVSLWPRPDEVLTRLRDSADSDEQVRLLTQVWLQVRGSVSRGRAVAEGDDLALREAFGEFAMQLTPRQRKTKVARLSPAGATHFHRVGLADVAKWLIDDVGNPTFLPQLARFDNLILKVVRGRRDASAVRLVTKVEASSTDLVIVLAPGLPASQSRTIRENIKRGMANGPIAVVDDLDLCRILNPGGQQPDPLLACLEIAAEQQPWSRFCPYEVTDGQNVRLEMFVGREDEAKKLVRQPTFGRIFSGRRLGKTALLRFLQGNPDFRQLPSNNRFEVVFCPITGMTTEAEVARAVVDELQAHLGLGDADLPSAPDRHHEPVGHLKALVRQLVDRRPSSSYLVLLDEADAFYGAQIAMQGAESQASLSWWMNRDAEKHRDSRGLPRIRFVFCGYLRTDQNRGVWENKGDVLLLRPLESVDAAKLVIGPLARLGIDVREQASNIAFRCGHQPAVIIRFGLELLEHLQRSRPVQALDTAVVQIRDVVDVFQRPKVQSDIRDACRLNFVGHDLGQLLFYALLMEFRARAPGAAVDEAPERILERIREVIPAFAPESLTEGTWRDLVARQLREFVDRSLLVQPGFRPATYRLRFPHHLPVLLQEDPAQYVRDALTKLKAAPDTPDADWLVPEAVLDQIRDCFSEVALDMGYRAVVVASHWPDPLAHPDQGLAARLWRSAGTERRPALFGKDAERAATSLADRAEVALLVGSPALARVALATESDNALVELAATGRLTLEQVYGWFKRRRAAEFTAQEAPRRIFRATRGIPILVRQLDTLLQAHFGEAPTLSEANLVTLLEAFDASLPTLAQRLQPGGGEDALTPRELDLVRMIVLACAEFGHMHADALLEDAAEDPEQGGQGLLRYRPADGPSLKLLLALGVLPRSVAGGPSALHAVGELTVDDPIAALLGLGLP